MGSGDNVFERYKTNGYLKIVEININMATILIYKYSANIIINTRSQSSVCFIYL